MSSSLPRPIDLRLPRAFVGVAIGLAAAAFGGLIAATLRTYTFEPLAPAPLLGTAAFASGLIAVVAASVAMRRRLVAQRGGVARAFAVAAVPTVGLGLFSFGALVGELRPSFLIIGALFGLAFVPIGALFGVVCTPVLRVWERLRRNPSHAGRISLCAGVGAWLVGGGLLVAALATDPFVFGIAASSVAVGLAAMITAGIVRVLRMRWLFRVASHQIDGWTIRDLHDVHVPLGLARWSAQPEAGGRPGVLCRVLGDAGLEPRLRVPAELLR